MAHLNGSKHVLQILREAFIDHGWWLRKQNRACDAGKVACGCIRSRHGVQPRCLHTRHEALASLRVSYVW